MPILATVAVSLLTGLSAFVGAYKYMPLNWLEGNPTPYVSSTITTILGTDTLSASRSVINTNFSNLNTDKAEITSTNTFTALQKFSASASSTMFSCYGTCYFGATATSSFSTAGALTLITPLLTVSGGTGSTTLASNQILLGNATGNIGIVSGFGTSGQFLTSNGADAAPTWQTSAVDQSASYNWTGSYFGVKNLNASSTVANPLTLNTLTYAFSSTRGASSTVPMEDGGGNISWNLPNWYLVTSTTTTAALAVATTTISGTPKYLHIVVSVPSAISGAERYEINFNNDTASVSTNYGFTGSAMGGGQTSFSGSSSDRIDLSSNGSATSSPAQIEIRVKNVATLPKTVQWQFSAYSSGAFAPAVITGAGQWNNTSATVSSIQLRVGAQTFPIGTTIDVYGSSN